MKIIILTHDGKMERIDPNFPLLSWKLNDSNNKAIFIPMRNDPNAFIRIKPNDLYKYTYAEINLTLNVYVHNSDYYDPEDNVTYTDVRDVTIYSNNIVEFINGIYNVYKYKDMYRLYENDQGDFCNTLPITYPSHIKITFYNEDGSVGDIMDTGDMGELHITELIDIDKVDEKCHLIRKFIYDEEYDRPISNDKDYCFKFIPDNNNSSSCKFEVIRKPKDELYPDDIILYALFPFNFYYMMTYQLYEDFITHNKIEARFVIHEPSMINNLLSFEDDKFNLLDHITKNDVKNSLAEYHTKVDSKYDMNRSSHYELILTQSTLDWTIVLMVFLREILEYVTYVHRSIIFGGFAAEGSHYISYIVLTNSPYTDNNKITKILMNGEDFDLETVYDYISKVMYFGD